MQSRFAWLEAQNVRDAHGRQPSDAVGFLPACLLSDFCNTPGPDGMSTLEKALKTKNLLRTFFTFHLAWIEHQRLCFMLIGVALLLEWT